MKYYFWLLVLILFFVFKDFFIFGLLKILFRIVKLIVLGDEWCFCFFVVVVFVIFFCCEVVKWFDKWWWIDNIFCLCLDMVWNVIFIKIFFFFKDFKMWVCSVCKVKWSCWVLSLEFCCSLGINLLFSLL